MPTRCGLKGCDGRQGINGSLHRIPKNEEQRRQWLDAIGTDNLRPNMKDIFICTKHFDEKSVYRTPYLLKLTDDAVPSLFLKNNPSESDSQQSPSSEIINRFPTNNKALGKALIKIQGLKKLIVVMRKKIKYLNQNVQRKKIKIAQYKGIIGELRIPKNNYGSALKFRRNIKSDARGVTRIIYRGGAFLHAKAAAE